VAEIGGDVRTIAADVTDEGEVAAAVAAAADAAPNGLRIAVACAGGSTHMGPLVTTGADELRSVLDVNVVGTFLTIKHATPHLVRNGGGPSSPFRRSRPCSVIRTWGRTASQKPASTCW